MADGVDIPDKVSGDPVNLKGLTASLKEVLYALDGNEITEKGVWAGVATLHDKRIVDVGVFAKAREE